MMRQATGKFGGQHGEVAPFHPVARTVVRLRVRIHNIVITVLSMSESLGAVRTGTGFLLAASAPKHGQTAGTLRANDYTRAASRHACRPRREAVTLCCAHNREEQTSKPAADDRLVREIPLASIRRPLAKSRANDNAKVEWLMKSIAEVRARFWWTVSSSFLTHFRTLDWTPGAN
jgi:hypothetical protein